MAHAGDVAARRSKSFIIHYRGVIFGSALSLFSVAILLVAPLGDTDELKLKPDIGLGIWHSCRTTPWIITINITEDFLAKVNLQHSGEPSTEGKCKTLPKLKIFSDMKYQRVSAELTINASAHYENLYRFSRKLETEAPFINRDNDTRFDGLLDLDKIFKALFVSRALADETPVVWENSVSDFFGAYLEGYAISIDMEYKLAGPNIFGEAYLLHDIGLYDDAPLEANSDLIVVVLPQHLDVNNDVHGLDACFQNGEKRVALPLSQFHRSGSPFLRSDERSYLLRFRDSTRLINRDLFPIIISAILGIGLTIAFESGARLMGFEGARRSKG